MSLEDILTTLNDLVSEVEVNGQFSNEFLHTLRIARDIANTEVLETIEDLD